MKFCYYLAAIGKGNFEVKLEVLYNNLKILNFNKEDIDIFINKYDDSVIDYENLQNFVNNIYINFIEKGLLSEFWLNDHNKEKLYEYDYIFLILDDVKLTDNFSIQNLIKKKEKFNLEIISPTVTFTHYSQYFLNHPPGKNFYLSNWIELFAYLMKPCDYFNYLNTLSVDNKSTCGNDWLIGYYNIKCGIDLDNIVNHLFAGKYDNTSLNKMNKLFKDIGVADINEYRNENDPIIEYFQNDDEFIIPKNEIYIILESNCMQKKLNIQKKLSNISIKFWSNNLQKLLDFLLKTKKLGNKFLIIDENTDILKYDILEMMNCELNCIKFNECNYLVSYENLPNFNEINWEINTEYFQNITHTSYLNLNLYDFEDWLFIPFKDSYGCDICRVNVNSLKDLKYIASNINGCVGYNTWGYIKNNINLNKLNIFYEKGYCKEKIEWGTSGLYIKKEWYQKNYQK